MVYVTITSPETENVGREISNEGIPAYAVVPAQYGANNQSREDEAGFESITAV
jgi:hypothetical protein